MNNSDSSVSPLSGTLGDEPTKETREWLRQSLNVVWLSEAEKQIADYITGLRREVAELRAASAPSAPSSADPSNLREIRGLVGVAAPSSAGTPEASEAIVRAFWNVLAAESNDGPIHRELLKHLDAPPSPARASEADDERLRAFMECDFDLWVRYDGCSAGTAETLKAWRESVRRALAGNCPAGDQTDG